MSSIAAAPSASGGLLQPLLSAILGGAAKPAPSSIAPAAAPSPSNLALGAYADASTSVGPSIAGRINDGVIDGYKEDDSGDESKEWVSAWEKAGAWVRLSFVKPVTINQIVLYDRPNLVDQITGATLTFSDNTMVSTGSLKNDGSATYVNLDKPKSISSITLKVSQTRRGTSMIGLQEMQLFNVDPSTFKDKAKTPTRAGRLVVRSNGTRHARDFSGTGEDYGADQVLVDSSAVKRSIGRDLVEEKLFA